MSSSPGSMIPLLKIKVQEKGKIKDIKEIIVRIDGLPSCLNGQIVDLGEGVRGIIMGYDEEEVLALALGDTSKLKMGKEVIGVSEPFKVPVGFSCLGRMVSAMGTPIDNKEEFEADEMMSVFHDSPPITHRDTIDEFLPAGTKIVDMLIPLAKGQRQLILGDRMTGKTAISVDSILNQQGRDMVCVYCCIGKSLSSLQKVVGRLKETGALEYTTVVAATDNSPAGEQYICPFTASAVAEYFSSRGKDVLVIFDDLTKHAWAYRQLSLLLERPPGREAYPGDIFYVQTQLMERAGKFSKDHGGGSMTFLGIAETLQNDLTGYIPSNLSSMCDGQICLDSGAFAEGMRPAVDIMVSLSIIGGKTQPQILKELSRPLRSDYAKYSEVVKLSKLSSGLSEEAEKVVNKGEVIRAIFQQAENKPATIAEEALLLFAVRDGDLLKMEEEDRRRFCDEIYGHALSENPGLVNEIETRRELTESIESSARAVLDSYFAGK